MIMTGWLTDCWQGLRRVVTDGVNMIGLGKGGKEEGRREDRE